MRFQRFFNRMNQQMLDTFPFNRNDNRSNAEKELDAMIERHERKAEEKKKE